MDSEWKMLGWRRKIAGVVVLEGGGNGRVRMLGGEEGEKELRWKGKMIRESVNNMGEFGYSGDGGDGDKVNRRAKSSCSGSGCGRVGHGGKRRRRRWKSGMEKWGGRSGRD